MREGNFFTGLNPHAIKKSISEGMVGIDQVAMQSPWRWDLGPRQYLVTAIEMRKKGRAEILNNNEAR